MPSGITFRISSPTSKAAYSSGWPQVVWGQGGWLSRWPAWPWRVRAYLHRSGGLGRSRSHRWTHTGPAASAGEAGRTSTRAHWCRWSTVAGRLARQRWEKEKGNLSLDQGHRPGASTCTAQFWRDREPGMQENNSTCLHLHSMYFLPGNAWSALHI